MKKWMCILLAGVLLLSMPACKKPAVATGEIQSTQNTEPDWKQWYGEVVAQLPESYQQVLNNEKKIRLQGYEELFFDSYLSQFPQSGKTDISVGQVTTPDGKQMLAIQRFEDTLVLYESDGVVYGNRYGFRGMYDLCTDGAYNWTDTDDQGLHYGTNRLHFQNGKFADEELYHIDQSDDDDTQYTLAGKPSTQAEVQAYCDTIAADKVTWTVLYGCPNG